MSSNSSNPTDLERIALWRENEQLRRTITDMLVRMESASDSAGELIDIARDKLTDEQLMRFSYALVALREEFEYEGQIKGTTIRLEPQAFTGATP